MMRFKNGKRRNNLIYDKYHQEKLEEEIKQLKEQLQQEKQQNNQLKDLEKENERLLNDKLRLERIKNWNIRHCIEVEQERNKITEQNKVNVESLKNARRNIEKMQKLIDDYKKEISFYKAIEKGYRKKLVEQEKLREQIILKNQKIYELKRKMNPKYRRFFPNNFFYSLHQPLYPLQQQNEQMHHLYYFNNPKYEEYINLNNIAKTANKKYK